MNEKRTKAEEIHYRNLTDKDSRKVAANMRKYIPLKQDGNIDDTLLSPEEIQFITQLSFEGKSTADIFEEWLEILRERDREMEPILEIIEVSSDGGSDDEERLKEVLRKLRSL